ncbi:MAG: response regulator [Cytophagaceae bacterium]|jgi:CheY-like chemotaxis protein|nr:response regulator [Cytophagaceae bacterium]
MGAEHYIDTILLVDDNETDNFIHKRVLELNSFAKNIVIKNSGKSALEFLQQNQHYPDAIPNVIFLDINMPIVDGFVFLFEYENFPDTVKNKTKIVILSSSDNKKDIDRIVDNDYVVHFLTKPLSDESLAELKKIV